MEAKDPGGLLAGLAAGIDKVNSAWGRTGLPVKIIVGFVILCAVGVPAFLAIAHFFTRNKKSVATVNGPTIHGPVIGQVGDHNNQNLTLVNNRSGYVIPKTASSELHGDTWITRVPFARSPGIWDPTSPTEITMRLSSPYEDVIVEGFSMMAKLVHSNGESGGKLGYFAFATTSSPDSNVSVVFRSKQPLTISELEVHPPGPPRYYRPDSH